MQVVTHAEGGYVLTAQGVALGRALSPLGRWAQAWAASLDGVS